VFVLNDTDPELRLETKAKITNGEIENIKDLLFELQNKKACHAEGKLLASVCHDICLEKALKKADTMQDRGSICYDSFKMKSTNCSRFAIQVTRFATKNWLKNYY